MNMDGIYTKTAEAVVKGERVIIDGSVRRYDPKALRDLYTVRLARIMGIERTWQKVADLERALLTLEEAISGIR
jgi:hypothetical protein